MRVKLAFTKGDGPVFVVTRKDANQARQDNRRAYQERLDKNKYARANVAVTKRPPNSF